MTDIARPTLAKGQRLASTGHSEHSDSFTAGQEAARHALLGVEAPSVLVCFGSIAMDHGAMLEGIRSVAGEVPVVGGSSGGVMTEAGWHKRGVVVLALGQQGPRIGLGLATNAGAAPEQAGAKAARQAAEALGGAAQTMMIFPEGGSRLAHNRLLDGLIAASPEAAVVGGASVWNPYLPEEDPEFLRNYQYWGDQALERSVPVLALGVEPPYVDAFAKAHGFMPIGLSGTCTASDGSYLLEIDGQPAVDYFKRYLGEGYRFVTDNAVSSLGLVRRSGAHSDLFVNTAFEFREDGAIRYYNDVPVGSEVQLIRTTRIELLRGTQQAAEDLKQRLGGATPLALFAFSCGGRQALLGERCAEELAQIQEVFGRDVPLIGCYSGGEFCPLAPNRESAAPGTSEMGVANAYTITLYAIGSPSR